MITCHEQQQARDFILYIAKGMRPLAAPPLHLSGNLEQSIDRWSGNGLRGATRDALDWSKDLEGTALAGVDAALANAALPTLTQMRARYAYAGPLFRIPVELAPED